MTREILIGPTRGPWGPLSPLYRRDVVFEGLTFGSTEAAFWYGRPALQGLRDWLMACPHPSVLRDAAVALPYWATGRGWSASRLDRMRRVQAAKFEQHADLRRLLLATADARIVYAWRAAGNRTQTYEARYWGEHDGHGRNHLGLVLMELRGAIGGHGIVEHVVEEYPVHPY